MDVKSFIVQGLVLKQKLIQTSFSRGDYIPINSFQNTLFCTNRFLLKKTWTQKNQKNSFNKIFSCEDNPHLA